MDDSKSENKTRGFPATVANVINEHTVAINRGKLDGIKIGQKMLIYELSKDEIIDPDTGNSLGKLEIVKGEGKVIHIQDSMATIESDKILTSKTIKKIKNPWTMFGMQEEIIETDPNIQDFNDPKVGDKIKPI